MSNSNRIRVGYLVGTNYCGSTLTAFLMNMHPEIASVGEVTPSRRARRRQDDGPQCSCGKKVEACQFWQDVAQGVQSQGVAFSLRNWTNDYRYANPLLHRLFDTYSCRPFVGQIRRAASFALPFHRQRILRTGAATVAFMQSILNCTKANVFFDISKALMPLYHLQRLKELEIRVVRMVRDVRSFVNSRKSRASKFQDVSVEGSADTWKRFYLGADSILANVEEKRVLTMRYEDLCDDPNGRVNEIYRFLGVAPFSLPDEIDSTEYHILGNRMRFSGRFEVKTRDDWRKGLSQNEVETALRIGGGLNERFGYIK